MIHKRMMVVYPLDTGLFGTGVWLGRRIKKGGMGYGLWNGFGGHIEVNETPEQAAVRELEEESRVKALKLARCGLTWNVHLDKGIIVELYFFLCHTFTGKFKPTKEMLPQRFPINQLPLLEMWESDSLVLPQILSGQSYTATFLLRENRMVGSFVQPVASLSELILKPIHR